MVEYVATRIGDAERGPQVRLNPEDARVHLITAGELVWVQGERGQQLAEAVLEGAIARHTCVLRDVPGVMLAEGVRVVKPDLDAPPRTRA